MNKLHDISTKVPELSVHAGQDLGLSKAASLYKDKQPEKVTKSRYWRKLRKYYRLI